MSASISNVSHPEMCFPNLNELEASARTKYISLLERIRVGFKFEEASFYSRNAGLALFPIPLQTTRLDRRVCVTALFKVLLCHMESLSPVRWLKDLGMAATRGSFSNIYWGFASLAGRCSSSTGSIRPCAWMNPEKRHPCENPGISVT